MKCKVKSTLKKRKKILRGRDEKKTNHQKLDILKMLLFHSMNPINSAWQKTRLCIKDSTKTIWNWLFHFSFTLMQVLELSCECLKSLDSLSFTLLVLLHFPDAEKNSKLQQNYQIWQCTDMLSYLSKTLLLLLNVNYFNYFRLYFHLYILLNSFIPVLAIFISLLL